MAARTSRIEHPTGGVFIQLHCWAVRAFGRDAAAVLGALDFLDRAQDQSGRSVASRTRLLADLEGVVSRYALDRALGELVELGFVVKSEREEFRRKNLTRLHEYALCPERINEFLRGQTPGVPNSERRPSEFGTDTGSESGTDIGSVSSSPSISRKEVETARELEQASSLSDELHALMMNAKARNQRSDVSADMVRVNEAIHFAKKAHLDEKIAATAIRTLREAGGWPRDALGVLKKFDAAQKKHAAEIAYRGRLAASPIDLDSEVTKLGVQILERCRRKSMEGT